MGLEQGSSSLSWVAATEEICSLAQNHTGKILSSMTTKTYQVNQLFLVTDLFCSFLLYRVRFSLFYVPSNITLIYSSYLILPYCQKNFNDSKISLGTIEALKIEQDIKNVHRFLEMLLLDIKPVRFQKHYFRQAEFLMCIFFILMLLNKKQALHQ